MTQKSHVLQPVPGPLPAPLEITEAWHRLSGCGAASRYLGIGPDGQHEVVLSDPRSGVPFAIGRGENLPLAICAAVEAGGSRKTGRDH